MRLKKKKNWDSVLPLNLWKQKEGVWDFFEKNLTGKDPMNLEKSLKNF